MAPSGTVQATSVLSEERLPINFIGTPISDSLITNINKMVKIKSSTAVTRHSVMIYICKTIPQEKIQTAKGFRSFIVLFCIMSRHGK